VITLSRLYVTLSSAVISAKLHLTRRRGLKGFDSFGFWETATVCQYGPLVSENEPEQLLPNVMTHDEWSQLGTDAREQLYEAYVAEQQCSLPETIWSLLGTCSSFSAWEKCPWQSLPVHSREERNRAIMEKRIATTAEQLCEELPGEFAQYMQQVRKTPKEGRPHYGRFRQKFGRLGEREGVKYDKVYDWTIRRFSNIR